MHPRHTDLFKSLQSRLKLLQVEQGNAVKGGATGWSISVLYVASIVKARQLDVPYVCVFCNTKQLLSSVITEPCKRLAAAASQSALMLLVTAASVPVEQAAALVRTPHGTHPRRR